MSSTAVSRKSLFFFNAPFFLILRILTNDLVHNGVGANMLKIGSKRRRTTNEVKVEREQSKMKAVDLQAKLSELRNMDA